MRTAVVKKQRSPRSQFDPCECDHKRRSHNRHTGRCFAGMYLGAECLCTGFRRALAPVERQLLIPKTKSLVLGFLVLSNTEQP